MVELFRVLRDIARSPSPFDSASVSISSSSTIVDELTSTLPTEAVTREQQVSSDELYQSLFAALAEHGDLPPDEPTPAAEPAQQLGSNTTLYSLIFGFVLCLLRHRFSAFSTASFY